jgi:hypothetical protein
MRRGVLNFPWLALTALSGTTHTTRFSKGLSAFGSRSRNEWTGVMEEHDGKIAPSIPLLKGGSRGQGQSLQSTA